MRLVLLATVLMVTPAMAAEIKVSADTFVIEETSQNATFTGNVIVTSEGFELTANKVLVRYGEGGSDDVRSFDATGSVRIKTADQTASGSHAVYDPSTEILTMSGGVTVENDAGTVTGPELTVNMKTKVTTFKSSGKGPRVTGVFTPQ